ncbi:MAG: tRNA-dihydrouridine synthase [Marinobacterium sp.]|nr:tRNA-dihydrouridine synthase [Marinobacterium sp.]
MKIILAPMEGVVDPQVRELLSAIGGIDQCVTEFVRISDQVLPARVFRRLSPELHNGGYTRSGTQVVLQLLGSHPELMARNALKAAKLGAPAIDLNFGCPAKTVNRNRGGAVLLDTPDEVYKIVRAVRQAVPEHIPVTAKMRLGNKDKTLALDNAQAIAEAGANGLAVHARTKVEGYRPPAHWEWIARIREAIDIPVVANGEVWTFDDYQRCREVSGCDDVMIGRGLIAQPDLGRQIVQQREGLPVSVLHWGEVCQLLLEYQTMLEVDVAPKYVHGRIKQWLHMMRNHYVQIAEFFPVIRSVTAPADVRRLLLQEVERNTGAM